ncbi:MAG: AAA family ATPase [Alphaproteobacteria bacterium]|nr:AAA family ATPase [Alphaproteobacteria bacterium]
MITSLCLTDFRNHKMCRINTHGRRNVIITGPNGAGKTAILEAVSMLGGHHGMRGAAMGDIARFGGNGGFAVFATLADDTEISISFTGGDAPRRAMIDGDAATIGQLASHMRIVWLTPREDRLFVDTASERRAFFDRLAASFDTAHGGRVARLSKLLSERAFALKNGRDNNWLNAIDAQIAATAVSVAAARVQYAGEINFFLRDAAVSVAGMVESMLIRGIPAGDAEREYTGYLVENRTLVGDKMVLDGPHKSDFGVFNQKLNLPTNVTSTGQQKTVLIDLILAHAKLIHTKTRNRPLILLDEAAAHLDSVARARLFSELGAADAQVWATGLEPETFRDCPDAVFVACADGEISNILCQPGNE